MGGGSWSVSSYSSRVSAKRAAGKDVFDHDFSLRSKPRSEWAVHESLDPKKANTVGKNVREAFDSDEHPESLPIAVLFDVTGSMHNIPRVLQQKLPQLHGLLQRKGYVEHPQILFGAIGDAYSDAIPLQIGQFESDNRGDEQLESFVLEGGGGGGNHESYELAAYYLARHSDLDSLKKRSKKGYLFIIGDERVYNKVHREHVENLIGDGLQEDLSTEQVFAELKEKYEVFFLFASQGSYEPEDTVFKGSSGRYRGYSDNSVCYWRDLLGQNAIILEDAELVCETIALTLGLCEGVVDLSSGLADLSEFSDKKALNSVSKAVAKIGEGTTAVTSTVTGSVPATKKDGAVRL